MTVEGAYQNAWYAGTPAVLRRPYGKGQVVHVAAFGEARFYQDLLAHLVAEAGIAPLLPGNLPEALEVTERRGPAGERLLFLLNWSDEPLTIPLPQPMNDLWSGQEGVTNATLPGKNVCILRSI